MLELRPLFVSWRLHLASLSGSATKGFFFTRKADSKHEGWWVSHSSDTLDAHNFYFFFCFIFSQGDYHLWAFHEILP